MDFIHPIWPSPSVYSTLSSFVLPIQSFLRANISFKTEMFQTVANTQQTTQLWLWKLEYLHHEQRPLYFGEWF